MTEQQLEVRKERAGNGTFVISRTEDGFRAYSVHNPSKMYLVKREGQRWTCTCPDFEVHKADTTWRCKHILAAVPWQNNGQAQTQAPQPNNRQVSQMPEPAQPPDQPPVPRKRARKGPNGSAQMLIKRSVSPDGRIDSVSVEFSMPVSDISNGEIKDKAVKTMQLQKEIVGSFLKLNGQREPANSAPTSQPAKAKTADGSPVFARMIDIGKVNGKWGERLCINFQINGRRCRLFGSAEQLAAHIVAAGYEFDPENVQDGLRLNLACRVVTKPSDDGKYLNVDKVLPLGGKAPKGGVDDSSIPY
jgi:hypothetical protein